MIISEGIVLKERPVGEQDKFIDILTKESGVVDHRKDRELHSAFCVFALLYG